MRIPNSHLGSCYDANWQQRRRVGLQEAALDEVNWGLMVMSVRPILNCWKNKTVDYNIDLDTIVFHILNHHNSIMDKLNIVTLFKRLESFRQVIRFSDNSSITKL